MSRYRSVPQHSFVSVCIFLSLCDSLRFVVLCIATSDLFSGVCGFHGVFPPSIVYVCLQVCLNVSLHVAHITLHACWLWHGALCKAGVLPGHSCWGNWTSQSVPLSMWVSPQIFHYKKLWAPETDHLPLSFGWGWTVVLSISSSHHDPNHSTCPSLIGQCQWKRGREGWCLRRKSH